MGMTDRPILMIQDEVDVAYDDLRAGRSQRALQRLQRVQALLSLQAERESVANAIVRSGLGSGHTQRLLARTRRAEQEVLVHHEHT